MSTPETAAVPQDAPVSGPAHRSAETYTAAALKRDIPESAADRHKLALTLCQSPVLPEEMRNPAGIHLYFAAAIAMRVPLFTAIKMLHVVKGKLTWESTWIRGRMIESGHKVRIMEATDKGATIRIIRHDDPDPHLISFTAEDAKRAQLIGKDIYTKFTADMYVARATTKAARWVCPEVFGGVMYSPADFDDAAGETDYYTEGPQPVPVPAAPVDSETVAAVAHEVTGEGVVQDDKRAALRNRIETAPDIDDVEEIRYEMGKWLDLELYDDGRTIGQALDVRLSELAHCAADDVIEVGVLNGDDDDDDDDDPEFPGDAPQPDAEAEAPEPDPEAACRMNAARKGILKGLEDRAPDGDVKALVMAEFGLPVENVSTSRLLALATHAAGKR